SPGERDGYGIPIVLALLVGLLAAGLIGGGLLVGSRQDESANRAALPSPTPFGEVAGASAGATGGAATEPTATAEPATPVASAAATTTPPGAARTPAPTTAPTAAPTVAAPAPAAQPPVVAARGRLVLDDDAFDGGFSAPRNYRGRTARWVYGAQSPY